MAIVASGQLTLVDLNDSKQLIMFIGSSQQRQVIYNPNGGSYTPNYSTANNVLTPQLFIAGTNGDIAGTADPTKTKWFYQTNSSGTLYEITASDTNYTLGAGAPKTLTIKGNVLSSVNSMTYICEMEYLDADTGFTVTAKSEYEIVKITNGTNGTNAIMGILSNDSHSVPTDSAGANGNFAGAVSTLTIYEGTTDVTASWTISQTKSNVTVTEAVTSRTATVTAMSADTGYVEFTATRSGYANVVKRFTLTKNKSGASGANATAYWLQSSQSVISKSAGGTYTPSTVTFSAKSQTGSANVANYTGVFTIEESTNGTTFTAKYTTANVATGEASTTYTPVANLKSIRVRLYQLGGTTVMLDEQVISVVTDGANGANGANAVQGVCWTPDGNAMKNSNATLKVQMDVYEGSNIVTPTQHKWYFQDPTASTDTGGGVGWRLLDATTRGGITGETTKTITVPASFFVNIESFKCVATYGGKTYIDVATLMDVSDPFMVTIVGINTFKNGVGTTSLTAKIYQAGAEVDSAGNQGYTYTWYLYDNNNVKIANWNTTGSKTGKTITVDGADVTVRGNIICEVSK